MSDGRSQLTDYKSHNELLKTMKGTSETSYSFRENLQATGLKKLQDNLVYNTCTTVPGGEIIVSREINLEIAKGGSYLDAFKPLISISFFK